ncbi:MAG TPA: hypothetical protein VIS56_02225 [Candidatus Saccharimonadales bacterium]
MDAKHYIELRKPAARGTDSTIADVMRHFNTRQHLGKAVVICDQPVIALSTARKQWLRLSRVLQKQRSSTLNADKILKYTRTITRMQRMHFTIKTPHERPSGEVYFLHPDNLVAIPDRCWSLYLVRPIDTKTALSTLAQLPDKALVIDYQQSAQWSRLGLLPKKALESHVSDQWHTAEQFLQRYDIDVRKLIIDGIHDPEAMDDALDTLLGGHSHEFLQHANSFQRALELSRPLRLKKDMRYAYDSLILLAHRVQALRPEAFSHHFLESYNEDDTFFLYDSARAHRHALLHDEALSDACARHKAAGRHRLAKSLKSLTKRPKNN